MYTIGALIACIMFLQKYGRLPWKIKGAHFRVYDGLDLGEQGKRLRFGVDLDDQYRDKIQSYAIKFEEREFGKFTVGVYSKETDSIQYNSDVRFALNDPIEKLVEKFPGNRYIEQFVGCLTSSTPEP